MSCILRRHNPYDQLHLISQHLCPMPNNKKIIIADSSLTIVVGVGIIKFDYHFALITYLEIGYQYDINNQAITRPQLLVIFSSSLFEDQNSGEKD